MTFQLTLPENRYAYDESQTDKRIGWHEGSNTTLVAVARQTEEFMRSRCPHHAYINWSRIDCDVCKLELLDALKKAQL